ncbi:Flagellar hook-associated protein 2 [marine gamma proteobacterium HTCC2143]|uniref:Flagellar hook-associated protein 2 n=1 Tax=marine gamma proteobacterium HTCC2143 TaxID=247633 RepID=A0YG73_9GAMM|nr:Flagellar hook-associated protein 2 [marine gamma proteobacterium HTCC2143]
MGITAIGTGSGIDLETLVTDLIAAEREPREISLNLKETVANAKFSSLGNLKSNVSEFRDSLASLKDITSYSARTATSGNTSLFTVTAEANANVGSYTIEVNTLANANKVATNASFTSPNSTVGQGTLTIGFLAGSTFDVTVADTDDLTAVRDAINNATDNVGVTASLITAASGTELVITANKTGAANQLNISVIDTGDTTNQDANGLSRLFYDGSDPANSINGVNQMQQIDAAQDAQIYVDGFAATSSTNEFSTVLEGVTITALADDGGAATLPSANMVVSADKTLIKSGLENFVAGYNSLVTVLNELTDYNVASNTSGLLSGETVIAGMETQIRRLLGATVESADSTLNNLALLGISTNRDGSIALDETALNNTIENNFSNIGTLMSGDDGIITRMDDLLGGFLDRGGLFATKEATLTTQLDDVADQRLNLELRLSVIEERYRSAFGKLDILVSRLNSTGNFLTQQLEAAAKISSGDR